MTYGRVLNRYDKILNLSITVLLLWLILHLETD